eukprot:jgi/Bigna1/76030/fgenesh1_pg.38_\
MICMIILLVAAALGSGFSPTPAEATSEPKATVCNFLSTAIEPGGNPNFYIELTNTFQGLQPDTITGPVAPLSCTDYPWNSTKQYAFFDNMVFRSENETNSSPGPQLPGDTQPMNRLCSTKAHGDNFNLVSVYSKLNNTQVALVSGAEGSFCYIPQSFGVAQFSFVNMLEREFFFTWPSLDGALIPNYRSDDTFQKRDYMHGNYSFYVSYYRSNRTDSEKICKMCRYTVGPGANDTVTYFMLHGQDNASVALHTLGSDAGVSMCENTAFCMPYTLSPTQSPSTASPTVKVPTAAPTSSPTLSPTLNTRLFLTLPAVSFGNLNATIERRWQTESYSFGFLDALAGILSTQARPVYWYDIRSVYSAGSVIMSSQLPYYDNYATIENTPLSQLSQALQTTVSSAVTRLVTNSPTQRPTPQVPTLQPTQDPTEGLPISVCITASSVPGQTVCKSGGTICIKKGSFEQHCLQCNGAFIEKDCGSCSCEIKGGAVAGLVIGLVFGVALIITLPFCYFHPHCYWYKYRKGLAGGKRPYMEFRQSNADEKMVDGKIVRAEM